MDLSDCYTLNEIDQQPSLWKEVYLQLLHQKKEISTFLALVKSEIHTEVIFTGAGSSFFIGEMVAGIFQKNTGLNSKAVSSTELVTHPTHYIPSRNKPFLLVSFARSGNSPESVGAVNLANKLNQNTKHLIITCNKSGQLAQFDMKNDQLSIVLPEAANDKGLAMTSSVTSMALSSILISQMDSIEDQEYQVNIISEIGANILKDYRPILKEISSKKMTRAVFLGSGPLMGVAREAHLKVQELTNGDLLCKFDSFLGFRHGPKAVVDNSTLMVYFLSNDPYVMKYENDLVQSIKNEQSPLYTIGIGNLVSKNIFDLNIELSNNEINEQYLTICSLLPIQLFAAYRSIGMGLNPDAPSTTGAIHRVVQGVHIYPFNHNLY